MWKTLMNNNNNNVDFAVQFDDWEEFKESEKRDKYLELA